jgi:adenylosuccinate lyase
MALLLQDEEVISRLAPEDLTAAFHCENFLTQVDFIFNRVFGDKA